MLGLHGGLPYPDSVYNGLFDLYHNNTRPIGHWDFTDTSTLYKDRDSYNNEITANNDLIGRVKNKAYINYPDTTRIGTFMRSLNLNDRPTYKTGGANGHSYALFDGSSGTHLFCDSTSSTYGAHSDDLLSTFVMINWALSIWVIGEPADNDSDGDGEIIFGYSGYRGEGSVMGASEDQTTVFNLEREDNDDITARWTITPPTGTVPVSPNLITATQADSHWSTGSPSIINVATKLTASESYIYNNGTPDVGQTIFGPTSGVFAQEGYSTMYYDWDDTKKSTFTIGSDLNALGTLIDGSGFDGKIYEILVYNLNTPNDSLRNAITSYFVSKYGI